MKDKCTKFESLFIFCDDNKLKEHLNECKDCREEYEKMQRVSSLIDEVKFYYHSKKRISYRTKAACAAIFLIISTFSLGLAMMNEDLTDTLKYGQSLSAEDLGFPVDSYGLLMVGE